MHALEVVVSVCISLSICLSRHPTSLVYSTGYQRTRFNMRLRQGNKDHSV